MKTKHAFSLVELSIVLVILGLLTGGILAGQSLIRAAELRSVTTEYNRYRTAITAFDDKYFSIPGDFRDATRFWGRMNSNADCVTNSSASVISTGACDGNGNASMDHPGGLSQAGEAYQMWRHLVLAGLIEGTYTGIAGPTTGAFDAIIGTNVPKSKLNGGGWSEQLLGEWAGGWPNFYTGSYGNAFFFGAQNPGNSSFNQLLKPEEAWNIDTKMDDGKPGTGRVIAVFLNNTCTTASSVTDYASTYLLTNTGIACALIFTKVM